MNETVGKGKEGISFVIRSTGGASLGSISSVFMSSNSRSRERVRCDSRAKQITSSIANIFKVRDISGWNSANVGATGAGVAEGTGGTVVNMENISVVIDSSLLTASNGLEEIINI
jgi:hypothetical protein